MKTLYELNQERLMEYTNRVYITPPRAEQAIPSGFLSIYEKKGWTAQIKKNGTNCLIFVSPEKEVTFLGRHGADNVLSYKPTKEVLDYWKRLPGDGWYVINAELMDRKTKHIKNVFYIHDVLVNDGTYLLGTTYAQRYKILMDLFLSNNGKMELSHFILNDNFWLARNIRGGFQKVFKELSSSEDEGLMLKRPEGLLTIDKNHEWMVKCRRVQKGKAYSF